MAVRLTGDFAARLRQAREQAGLRQDDASYLVRQLFPKSMTISRETIRRYENGSVAEDRANPIYVKALAIVYKVPVKELSQRIADDLKVLNDQVMSQSAWSALVPA